MKVNNYLLGLFVLSVLNLFGCKKNIATLENTDMGNLIRNSSFEENGQPSLKFWNVQDTSKINFSKDVPPGGGHWSVYLHSEWYGPLPETPSCFIPLSSGTHILKFSIYGKSKTFFGSALLILKKGNVRKIVDQNSITDSIWTKYSIVDTLNISEGDSLFVLLYGGGTEIVDGITYFDLAELEPIDGD